MGERAPSKQSERGQDETTKSEKQQQTRVNQPCYFGLYNQGATCYLNSVLQILFMTPEIHHRLDQKKTQTDDQLLKIFEGLKKDRCGTENLTKCLEIENVYQQCDAAEFLDMILHKVSTEASEVFQTQLTYTTKCSEGHSVNKETTPYWTHPLSLRDTHDTTYSVERGFKRIFQTITFSGDNLVYCEECEKKTEATTGCEMVESPQILTLLLKRFDFDYNTMSHIKSNCCVDVPRALQTKNKKYKLYGMVNHMGSLCGGHYTATIWSNEDETWYDFDDARVKMAEEQPFVKHSTYNSRTAYLLMYRATESQMPCETNSEGLTDSAERNTNTNEEEEQMDEEPMRKKPKREDCDAEGVKNEIETHDDINMETGEDCGILSELINSGHEETQGHLSINGDSTHSSTTQEITNDTFEDLNETELDDAALNLGESTTESSQHLDEDTKTEKKKQRATECQIPIETESGDDQGEDTGLEQREEGEAEEQPFVKHDTDNSRTDDLLMYKATESQMPCETNSEGLTDSVSQKEDETSNLDELKQDDRECKENVEERHDNEEEEQNDEEPMRNKEKREDLSHQTGGEEGDAEGVMNEIETHDDINMETGEDCGILSELINSGHEETQGHLSINGDSTHSSTTQEVTNYTFEDLNETELDDVALNLGESTTESSQHLDEDTKTEKKQRDAAAPVQRTEYTEQSPTEYQMTIETESGDDQGEDTGLEQWEEGEVRILLEPTKTRPVSKASSRVRPYIVFGCLLLVVLLLFVVILSLMKLN